MVWPPSTNVLVSILDERARVLMVDRSMQMPYSGAESPKQGAKKHCFGAKNVMVEGSLPNLAAPADRNVVAKKMHIAIN